MAEEAELLSFIDLTYEDATTLIPPVDEANELFAAGDHWQGGKGWTGPLPAEGHPGAETARAYIERIFVAEDVIGDILERHAMAVVGRPFTWTLTEDADEATPETQTAVMEQLERILQQWLNQRKVTTVLKDALASSLWAARGLLRLYIPANRLKDGQVPALPFAELIDLIHVDSPAPRQATVVTEETQQLGAVHLYTRNETDYAELCYIDEETEARETVLRVVNSDDTPVGEEVRLDLDGNLLMHQINNTPLIDASMRALQRKVNHAATAEQANLTTAGWVTRLFLNANPPGSWSTDELGNQTFTPAPLEFGPGKATFIPGIPHSDANGGQRLSNPSYVRDEPAPVTTFIETKESTTAVMLHNARQEHILMADNPNASGSSRLRARSDFQNSLAESKVEADRAITWLLRTLILFAGRLASDGEQYANVHVSAEAVLDVGTLTAQEMQSIVNLWTAGAISQQTMLSWLGIADVEAEMQRILEERAQATAVEGGAAPEGKQAGPDAAPAADGAKTAAAEPA